MLLPDSSLRSKGVGGQGLGTGSAFCLEKQFDEHSLLSGPVVFSTVSRTCKGHTASRVISHILNTSASLIFHKVKPLSSCLSEINQMAGLLPVPALLAGKKDSPPVTPKVRGPEPASTTGTMNSWRCWRGTVRSSPGPRCLRSTIHDGDICPLLSTDRTQGWGKSGLLKIFLYVSLFDMLLKSSLVNMVMAGVRGNKGTQGTQAVPPPRLPAAAEKTLLLSQNRGRQPCSAGRCS